MSTLYVDTINEKTSGNGVQIPGHVVQVVQATTTTPVTITGTTYTDTNLSGSITPKSASSKILVTVNQQMYPYSGSNIIGFGIRLLRGATSIYDPATDSTGPLSTYLEITGASQIYHILNHPITYLDSPNTTSSVTYKTQSRVRVAGTTVLLQWAANAIGGTSTITLMEIAQ